MYSIDFPLNTHLLETDNLAIEPCSLGLHCIWELGVNQSLLKELLSSDGKADQRSCTVIAAAAAPVT